MNSPLPKTAPHTDNSATNTRLMLWLSKLPKHVLALDSDVVDNIISELNNPNVDSERLAFHIRQDPILCLKLYLKGARQLKEREGTIQGLIHLLGLLGQKRIHQVINDAPKVCNISNGQRELLAASLFAAHFASELLPEKHGTKSERFFLPALLFNAPLWLMWVAAPKTMEQGQRLASQKCKSLEPLCQKALGFSLPALLEQTQLFLPLPELTLKALTIDLHHDLPLWARIQRLEKLELQQYLADHLEAKRRFNDAATGIYLINHFVLAHYLDWDGKHIRRWTRLLVRHLAIDEDTLHERIIATAREITFPLYLSGPFAPLYRYRGMHRQIPPDTADHNIAIIKQYASQLRESDTLRDSMQLTLEAMTTGAQVEHCMILTVANNRLQIPMSHGFSDKAIETINLDFRDCGKLLQSLLKEPMAIAIDNAKLNRIRDQLPSALTRYWQPRPCGLMSLFHNNKPYAIVICDHKQWDDKRHQQFKAIGKQLAQTLKTCKKQ